MTPREAWNEANDELVRAVEVLTLARFTLDARRTTRPSDEAFIKYAEDRVAAAEERYHEARTAEEAACRRIMLEEREARKEAK